MLCSGCDVLVVWDYDEVTGNILLFGYCAWVFIEVFILFRHLVNSIRD